MRFCPCVLCSLALFATTAGLGVGCSDDQPVPSAPGQSSIGGAGAGGAASVEGTCAVAPSTAPDSLTHYACDTAPKDLLCTDGNPLLCTPIDKERGTVPSGGVCQGANGEAAAAAKYELGDDCAPNIDFFWPEWPKGSFCLAEGGTTFCSHACHIDLHCADLAAASGVPSPFCGEDEHCHLTGGPR